MLLMKYCIQHSTKFCSLLQFCSIICQIVSMCYWCPGTTECYRCNSVLGWVEYIDWIQLKYRTQLDSVSVLKIRNRNYIHMTRNGGHGIRNGLHETRNGTLGIKNNTVHGIRNVICLIRNGLHKIRNGSHGSRNGIHVIRNGTHGIKNVI